LVSDIPAGDGNVANLFLQCTDEFQTTDPRNISYENNLIFPDFPAEGGAWNSLIFPENPTTDPRNISNEKNLIFPDFPAEGGAWNSLIFPENPTTDPRNISYEKRPYIS
jgi:hypothetical protein